MEISVTPQDDILIRDSKNPTQPPLVFTRGEFRAWIDAAKAGEFDDI